MGGLAGHMMHPHDNMGLTINGFIEIFTRTVANNLPMSEKLDGFNIHILNKEGEIRFARNGKDLMEGGFGASEIENRFSNERVREVFRRGFEMAMNDSRFELIPDWDLFHYTINAEIIVGRTNIMPYESETIIPHNIFQWSILNDKAYIYAVKDLPEALKTNLPGIWVDAESDFNKKYWVERIWKVFEGFTEDDTIEEYYAHKFQQVVMSVMGSEFSHELIRAMFNRFFGVGEKVNLRELRKEFGEDIQKFLDLEKQLVFLTKDDLDQMVLEMGTYILEHFRGVNWVRGTQYKAMDTLHSEIMNIINADPEGTKIFAHRWMACKNKIFATEGLVVEYGGERYKWTGPFAPVNQLLGGRR